MRNGKDRQLPRLIVFLEIAQPGFLKELIMVSINLIETKIRGLLCQFDPISHEEQNDPRQKGDLIPMNK
jgi:hypothetical protein